MALAREPFATAVWNSWLMRIGVALAVPGAFAVAVSFWNLDRNPNSGVGGLVNNLFFSAPLVAGLLCLLTGVSLCAVAVGIVAVNRRPSPVADYPSARIAYSDGSTEFLRVSIAESPDLFRLEETMQMGEGLFHDVIQAERQSDGSLLFRRIVAPSGLVTQRITLRDGLQNTGGFRQLRNKIAAVGGTCEERPGGLFLVHTLPQHAEDIRQWLEHLLDATT